MADGKETPASSPAPLAHFHQALGSLGTGEGKVRIVVYTDSVNASDRVTSALRHRLQSRFGNGGKGWVPLTPGWTYQKHQDVRWETSGAWKTWVVNRRRGPMGRYGLGGVVSESRAPGAQALFQAREPQRQGSTAGSLFQLYYQQRPGGGDANVSWEDGTTHTLTGHADRVQDVVFSQPMPGGWGLVTVTATQKGFRAYGVVMERAQGVVVDSMMLVGAFTRVLSHFDRTHWQRQVALRQPDLLMFWLGGNDAISRTTGFSTDSYVGVYRDAIRTARSGRPGASCAVVSVLDSGQLVDGRPQSVARIPIVVRAQKRVAEETECAFINLYELEGGRGTALRWRARSPHWIEPDYHHLTRAGATHVGHRLAEQLLRGSGL